MGYFPVRYTSRVVIYERKMFIRLATRLPLHVFRCIATCVYLYKGTCVSQRNLIYLGAYMSISNAQEGEYVILPTYQCEQMARLFFHIWSFTTHENLPNSIQNLPNWALTFA